MNNSRLIFDNLRQRKQLYTIVLASILFYQRRIDENSVRIIIEIISALHFLTPNFQLPFCWLHPLVQLEDCRDENK